MGKFQVGPAQLRDGREAFICAVEPNGGMAICYQRENGAWVQGWRYVDGTLRSKNSEHDVMPNVPEPEVDEWYYSRVWEKKWPHGGVTAETHGWCRSPGAFAISRANLRARFVDGKLEVEVIE